jgi:hypothetical protein
MSEVTPDVFLSYNRDDQVVAKLFAEAFEAASLSVWWDVTLRSGEAYDQVTEEALRTARAVVVLWSRKSVVSLARREQSRNISPWFASFGTTQTSVQGPSRSPLLSRISGANGIEILVDAGAGSRLAASIITASNSEPTSRCYRGSANRRSRPRPTR